MPLIAFVGDTHYRFYQMYDAIVAWEKRADVVLDAIVHVGDFGVDLGGSQWSHLWNVDKEVPIETYVIMGNHENMASIKKWQAEPDRIARLHLLPDGGVTDVVGVKIASVWGNYSPKSWLDPDKVKNARSQYKNHSLRALHIYRPAVDELLKYDGKIDVLVTHDCATIDPPPQFRGKPVPESLRAVLGLDHDEVVPPGCPGFTELLTKLQPLHHFYGHLHVRYTEELERQGTKVHCLNAFDIKPNEAVEIVDFK